MHQMDREETNSIGKSGSSIDLSSTLKSGPFIAPIQSKKERYLELFWEHKHTTVTICFVFWSFGTCVAFLGPTFLDLACKMGVEFRTMSWVFFSQALFILFGSACAGFMLRRLSAEIMLLMGITMMTLSMTLISFCNTLWTLTLVLSVMGFFMGTIDTVANVSMICIYGKDVSPFLQAIHFFYGVGAFVSPMIVEPFLLNKDCDESPSNATRNLFPEEDNETLPTSAIQEDHNLTRIDYAFFIMALTMVPVVILAFSLLGKKYCLQMLGGGKQNLDNNLNKDYEDMGEGLNDALDDVAKKPFQVYLVKMLSACLLFVYDGLQATYGAYIHSYAVKGPTQFHSSDAAYLNALFWGMFATGRLLSIALATKLSPSFMLFCNILGCNTGLLLMLALRYSHIMLIIGTCMLGIFMSSVFPTTLSLTEQYIHVTPTITSFLVFGAAAGEMSLPVYVGHQMDFSGPINFLVVGLVLCFISIIVYMSLWLAGLTLLKPDSTPGIMVLFSKLMPNTVQKLEGENTSLVMENLQYYSRMNTSPTQSLEEQEGVINFVKKETDTSL